LPELLKKHTFSAKIRLISGDNVPIAAGVIINIIAVYAVYAIFGIHKRINMVFYFPLFA